MSKVRMYEAKPRIYESYEYYIHSSLEAKQSHNIKRANEASCDVHIFVCFKLRSIPIHPTRYNFTSAYIICHICCILITCLYYIRNRFTDASSYARIYLTTNLNHKRNERRENVKRIYK